MKKKNNYAKFIGWCLDEAWRIQGLTHLTNYRIRMDNEPNNASYEYAFEIHLNYPYQDARLAWKLSTYEEWEQGKLKTVSYYLLHEMLHLLTQPYANAAFDRHASQGYLKTMGEELTDKIAILLRYDVTKKWEDKK